VQFIGRVGRDHPSIAAASRSKPEGIIKEPITDKDVNLYKSPGHQRDWLQLHPQSQEADLRRGSGRPLGDGLPPGNLAYWNHKTLKWDPKEWKFIGDAGDNKWLDRDARGGQLKRVIMRSAIFKLRRDAVAVEPLVVAGVADEFSTPSGPT